MEILNLTDQELNEWVSKTFFDWKHEGKVCHKFRASDARQRVEAAYMCFNEGELND